MCTLGVIRTDLRLRWVRIDPTSGRSWCRELFCRWRKCVVNCTIIIFDHICVKLTSMHNDDVNAISLRRWQSTRDASRHWCGTAHTTFHSTYHTHTHIHTLSLISRCGANRCLLMERRAAPLQRQRQRAAADTSQIPSISTAVLYQNR